MSRPKNVELTLKERLKRIRDAGLTPPAQEEDSPGSGLAPMAERIRQILHLVRRPAANPYDMLYLVMYDIEDDRVRTAIAKYLLSKGCIRIQKSVYMARSKQREYHEISKTLKEVQEAYDNSDSILLVPVTSTNVGSMQILGKDIQIESIIDPPNTLFF
jgi:CRISPR-associated endonuclease Cas2